MGVKEANLGNSSSVNDSPCSSVANFSRRSKSILLVMVAGTNIGKDLKGSGSPSMVDLASTVANKSHGTVSPV